MKKKGEREKIEEMHQLRVSQTCMQNMEDKHWKNEEVTKLEETLPRPKECELEKAS